MKNAVFFDLDGTLLDTAQDFAYTINLLLAEENKPPVNFSDFRAEIYGESKRMICFAFKITETHPDFKTLQEKFLHLYHLNCTKKTVFFPGIQALLTALNEAEIPWGIITNKPTWLTTPIVTHFDFKQACCVIAGDTLAACKPNPLPLLHACKIANISPSNAIYVGDSKTDVIAAKNAGMKSIAVTYGYHPSHENILEWHADYVAHHAKDILMHLKTCRYALSPLSV